MSSALQMQKLPGGGFLFSINVVVANESELDASVLDAIRQLMELRRGNRPSGSLADTFEIDHLLSPREREIVKLICQGNGNKDIARELHVTENTLNSHMKNIYRKCNVSNRSTLILLANGQPHAMPTLELNG